MPMFFPILWPLDGYKFGESGMDFFFSQKILCISLPWSEILKSDWQCLMTVLLVISLWYPSLCGFKLFTASVKQAACRQSQTLRGFSAEHKAILASNFFQHYLPEMKAWKPAHLGLAMQSLPCSLPVDGSDFSFSAPSGWWLAGATPKGCFLGLVVGSGKLQTNKQRQQQYIAEKK